MAFASKRFDRQNGMRIPMQSLAAYTGADYKVPGSLDYRSFLRETLMCTQDVRQRLHAFKRAVFNVLFNNRDDHTKNFSFLMAKNGQWTEANLTTLEVDEIILAMREIALQFSQIAQRLYPHQI